MKKYLLRWQDYVVSLWSISQYIKSKGKNCRYRNVNLCNITFLLTHQILINYMLALGNSFISYIRRYTDIEEEMKTKNRIVASSCNENEKKFYLKRKGLNVPRYKTFINISKIVLCNERDLNFLWTTRAAKYLQQEICRDSYRLIQWFLYLENQWFFYQNNNCYFQNYSSITNGCKINNLQNVIHNKYFQSI